MTTAAIYARISKDTEGTGLGVARQQNDCLELAKRRGWDVADIYIDNDISAFSGKTRPRYKRLLEDIQEGPIKAVVVYHLDRLHRRPSELEEFMEICDSRGIELATVQGEVDLSTSSGRLYARLMGAVARHESEHKSERIKRKFDELARAGKDHGGCRPFGYEDDHVTVRAAEAAVVREAAQRIIEGEGLHTVCRDFNRRGIGTATGTTWKTTILRRIVAAPRTAGQREHRGQVVGMAEWPAILDAETSIRLRSILFDPRRKPRRPAQKYLLSSIVQCGVCGKRMWGRPNNSKRQYECVASESRDGCGHIGIRADLVENIITEAVICRLGTPRIAQAMLEQATKTEVVDLVAVDSDRKRMDELALLFSSGQLTAREWMIAREPLEKRIEANSGKLGVVSPIAPLIGEVDIRKHWAGLTFEKQRAILSYLLDAIVIESSRANGRVKRWNPERIKPIWRV